MLVSIATGPDAEVIADAMGVKTILLFGPQIRTEGGAYGGGTGGYSRNMSAHLSSFRSEEFTQAPCFHTVRQSERSFRNHRVPRLFIDTYRFVRDCLRHRPSGVHILGLHVNRVTYREAAIVLLARLMRIPVLYEIKAGAFVEWYDEQAGLDERALMRFVLRHSAVILCEGVPYVDFVKQRFGLESHYFPNFVPDAEIPSELPDKFGDERLRVMFAGYCYDGKGVFDLVTGCDRAARAGSKIRLDLIGQESEDFAAWLDTFEPADRLELVRNGLQPHDFILQKLEESDVYCYPTRHGGEGHNNSINEAMMYGLCILVTRWGFLEDVLSEDAAIFLDGDPAQAVADALRRVDADRSLGAALGKSAQQRLRSRFSSGVISPVLEAHYRTLTV
jgi:glycosyltransferase involved in cell wall biosynthesis